MKPKNKILKKILPKLDMKADSPIYYRLIQAYMNDIHRKNTWKPKNKKKYIGIEIECFGDYDNTQVMALILKHDLEKYIDISYDGSIEADDGSDYSFELRILSSEDELTALFKKLSKFLKEGKFKVNDTCGLHVHLDMRHRNVSNCYQKLLKFQDIMFGMVNKERWTNEYCAWSTDLTRGERYSAINWLAYVSHRTLEIRLHQGSVNALKIENWVKLLLKMIEDKETPEIKSKIDVLKWAGGNKKLKSYLNRFNSSWFSQKDEILGRQNSMRRNY